jgi:Fic family protein
MQTGAGAGFGQAAQRLSQYYIKLAEDLQPVIEVNALREVGIVLTKGVDLMADYQDTTNTMGQAGNMGTVMMPTPPTQAALMGQMVSNNIQGQLPQMQPPTQQPFTQP